MEWLTNLKIASFSEQLIARHAAREIVLVILLAVLLGDLATVTLNKGECNLNQSKENSFVERVAKNNSWNKHKIPEIFLLDCFVFVWKTVHSSAMTQIKAHLLEKALQLSVLR